MTAAIYNSLHKGLWIHLGPFGKLDAINRPLNDLVLLLALTALSIELVEDAVAICQELGQFLNWS